MASRPSCVKGPKTRSVETSIRRISSLIHRSHTNPNDAFIFYIVLLNEAGASESSDLHQGNRVMKHLTLIVAAGSLAAISAPASAADLTSNGHAPVAVKMVPNSIASTLAYGDPPRHARAYGRRYKDRYDDRYDDYDDDYRERRRYRGEYDRHGRYYEPRRLNRRDRIWRGRDGNYYCKRGNGTTGLVVGAGVGALIGRTIDTRGDRTLGTLLGGALGAVIGREIDRGELRCR